MAGRFNQFDREGRAPRLPGFLHILREFVSVLHIAT
jgi:hypothetical protein